MSLTKQITFVIAVNSKQVFEKNFLASPGLGGLDIHQILVQRGFSSAAKAYNDGINRAASDLIAFCHQDIVLPERWLSQVNSALRYLDVQDPDWGVLGCYGNTHDGRGWGHLYSSGLGVLGRAFRKPVAVQTLDEIVLIFRKSSGLRFDDSLPHFHFYGTDICLSAARMGRRNYAISAFCIHNTHQPLVLPKEFYECYRHIRYIWHDYLPVQTSCIRITKSNFPLYSRRLRELYLRHIRRKEHCGTRVPEPMTLLKNVNANNFSEKYLDSSSPARDQVE